MAKRYVFDGKNWNKLSPRYQTRRLQEKVKKDAEQKQKLDEYKAILENPDEYDEETLRLTKLKYNTLLKNFKVVKSEKPEDIMIPLRLDQKTVVFVKERDIFKTKYVKKFGIKWLKNRVEQFKRLLKFKPADIVYWNPF